MSTLSVPLTPQLEAFIERMIDHGYAENKAQVVRHALRELEEDQAVASLLKAQKEAKECKVLYGKLDELAKKIK